jgi:hypothetical protein
MPNMRLLRISHAIAFSLIAFLTINLRAQTTQPAADDAPISPVMAPTYIAIGRQLCMRLDITRRTVDDLKLDPAMAKQADEMIDTSRAQLADLLYQLQSGRLPPNRIVQAVPVNLRAARDRLFELIGPDQTQKLQEMLQSIRGETRDNLGRIRLMLEDLHLPDSENKKCQSILSDADSQAESLPQEAVQGNSYDEAREKMTNLLDTLHTRLCSVLTDTQRQQLGPRFAQLAQPTTRTAPSPPG